MERAKTQKENPQPSFEPFKSPQVTYTLPLCSFVFCGDSYVFPARRHSFWALSCPPQPPPFYQKENGPAVPTQACAVCCAQQSSIISCKTGDQMVWPHPGQTEEAFWAWWCCGTNCYHTRQVGVQAGREGTRQALHVVSLYLSSVQPSNTLPHHPTASPLSPAAAPPPKTRPHPTAATAAGSRPPSSSQTCCGGSSGHSTGGPSRCLPQQTPASRTQSSYVVDSLYSGGTLCQGSGTAWKMPAPTGKKARVLWLCTGVVVVLVLAAVCVTTEGPAGCRPHTHTHSLHTSAPLLPGWHHCLRAALRLTAPCSAPTTVRGLEPPQQWPH
jgi:hypothetical protein